MDPLNIHHWYFSTIHINQGCQPWNIHLLTPNFRFPFQVHFLIPYVNVNETYEITRQHFACVCAFLFKLELPTGYVTTNSLKTKAPQIKVNHICKRNKTSQRHTDIWCHPGNYQLNLARQRYDLEQVKVISQVKDVHFLFRGNRPLSLRYNKLNIWPWLFKVKVITKGIR